jgi:hypothetical protein
MEKEFQTFTYDTTRLRILGVGDKEFVRVAVSPRR